MFDLADVPLDEVYRKAQQTQVIAGAADISRRSLLAFLKTHKESAETPTPVFIEHAAKLYAALVQREQIAAIYRVRNDLQLKRMRRIPEAVAYAAEKFRRENGGT